jgi:hypothetical protein
MARLHSSLIMGALLMTSVIFYQWTAYNTSFDEVKNPPKTSDALFTSIQVFPQTLPVLERGQYQLNIIDSAGATHTISRFTINSSGQVFDANARMVPNAVFLLPQSVYQVTSAQVLLTNGVSSPLEFLSGTVTGDRASLSFEGMAFNGAKGEYMLATPTDGNNNINERSGVWFGDYQTNDSALRLPPLKRGWVYEGWAIVDGRPLTTGRFTSPVLGDRFSGFSDTQANAPRIPGEDFLRNPPVEVFPGLQFPVDLAGQVIRVSLEPDVEGIDPTGQAPFGVAVLEGEVPNRAEPRELYELKSLMDALPKATIVLR